VPVPQQAMSVAFDLRAPPGPRALFLAFLGVGMSGFGGVLPFARRTLVERLGWLAAEDFNELLALCQSLPGPNIVNLSVVLGSRYAGVAGALSALAGLVVGPAILILVIAELWARFGTAAPVAGAIRGLSAAAAGLAGATALKMARPVLTASPLTGGLVMAGAFISVGLAKLPLVWVMAGLAPLSVALAWRRRG